jgi:hypothetical protein
VVDIAKSLRIAVLQRNVVTVNVAKMVKNVVVDIAKSLRIAVLQRNVAMANVAKMVKNVVVDIAKSLRIAVLQRNVVTVNVAKMVKNVVRDIAKSLRIAVLYRNVVGLNVVKMAKNVVMDIAKSLRIAVLTDAGTVPKNAVKRTFERRIGFYGMAAQGVRIDHLDCNNNPNCLSGYVYAVHTRYNRNACAGCTILWLQYTGLAEFISSLSLG